MAVATGTALIRHAETGIVYEIPAADILFETTGYEDRKMGPEFRHEASVHHLGLGELAWLIWEYPSGVENDRETVVEPHFLMRDIEIDFNANPWNEPQGARERDISAEERQDRVDEMVQWFGEHFEDPAEHTSYISREGGYQWVLGGPYDARSELADNFPDEDEEVINLATAELEAGGITEWASILSEEDYGGGDIDDDELSAPANAEVAATNFVLELEDLVGRLPEPDSDPAFVFREDNLLHLKPPPDLRRSTGNQDLLEELQGTLSDLLTSLAGTNAYPQLLQAAARYNDALNGEVTSASQIYGRGVRLSNASHAAERSIQAGDTPSLPYDTEQHLRSTLHLHAAYMMTEPEAVAIADAAASFQRPTVEVETLHTAIEEIGASIAESPNLFANEVRQLVAEVVADFGHGTQPERSAQVASKTLGHLATTLLKGVVQVGGAAIIASIVAGSTPGAFVIATGIGSVDAAWAFLIANAEAFRLMAGTLGTNLGWTEPMARVFDRIRQIRASKV
ncbi:hypothetical protein [uncultured Maricaulis sp.]|uniref:hypothetical protein n=1 Tax=uncultured Maricaulis sp. TaxID=174710 RepID=UPI0030D7F364|tara:strand:- start:58621 stop:60156 length:1536 start_codon:yes stop_codon:yes gene_type:complete